MARAPQLVGPARAAAGEVEIEADDDALAGRMIARDAREPPWLEAWSQEHATSCTYLVGIHTPEMILNVDQDRLNLDSFLHA